MDWTLLTEVPEAGRALAGLGLAGVPWAALPWREGVMLALPVVGTALGRMGGRNAE